MCKQPGEKPQFGVRAQGPSSCGHTTYQLSTDFPEQARGRNHKDGAIFCVVTVLDLNSQAVVV